MDVFDDRIFAVEALDALPAIQDAAAQCAVTFLEKVLNGSFEVINQPRKSW
jgi:hypothetical protein